MATQQTNSITARLNRVRRTVSRRQLVWASIMAVGLVALATMLADGVNRFVPLRESGALIFLAVALALGVGFLVLRWFTILFRSGSTADVALAVEAAHPEFMDALVCAAELEAAPPEQLRGIEQALLDKVGGQTHSFDFLEAIFPAFLRWRKLAVPAVVFALIAGVAVNTEPAAKARQHFRDLRSGTPSGLVVRPGDMEVPEHTDVRIEAHVRRWDNEASIVYEVAGERRQRFAMNKGVENNHFFTLYDVTDTIRYRVLTPSLAGRWHTVVTFSPPVLNAAALRIVPPEYTGLEPIVFPDLRSCSAVVGSRVRICLEVDPDVEALLMTEGGLTAFAAESDTTRILEQELTSDLHFRVRLLNRHGRHTDSPGVTIKAVPDLPPLVEVLSPRRDLQALAEQEVPLEARASDDFGLRQVALSYSISGGERQSITLFESAPAPASADGSLGARRTVRQALDEMVLHHLDLAALQVAEGDVVAYFFTALDNRVPEPQRARSEVYFVVVRPEMQPEESEMEGQKREFDVSALIAETKRLIRMTWDVLGVPDGDRQPLAEELLMNIKDLRLAIQRSFNDLASEAGAAAGPLLSLLEKADEEMGRAQALIERNLLPPSLSPQERALAQLVALENELIKNTMRSKKGESAEGEGSSEDQEQQPDRSAEQQEGASELAAIRQMLETLRRLSARQDQLNEQMRSQSARDEAGCRGLAQQQAELESESTSLAGNMAAAPELRRPHRETQAAGGEMQQSRQRLQQYDPGMGQRHGNRAHNFLLAAVRSMEEAYRRAAANEIARLREHAQRLAAMQQQAGEHSTELATWKPDEETTRLARERQQDINHAADVMMSHIGRAAGELEEAYPDAAEAVRKVAREARESNLSGQMTRAANALLYRRFDRAAENQAEAAGILGRVASQLAAAQQHLPAVSRDELLEALEAVQQGAQQVRQLSQEAERRSNEHIERIRRQVSQRIDPLAAAMHDPALERVGEALAQSMGDGDSGQQARRLLTLFQAATAVLEKHLFAAEFRKRAGLSRHTSVPPEKYRRLVEQYFKDLSREQ